jgi:2-amino-4-hydroxy-6-hydroxymethyldihydropteridine diphosphokinase
VAQYILSLGSNRRGSNGGPAEELQHALDVLPTIGLRLIAVSHFYLTAAISPLPQPHFVNCAVIAVAALPPAVVLRRLKQLERQAGRSRLLSRGSRILDIDIVDCKGWLIGWPLGRGKRPHLVVPHPLAHTRAFVLDPVGDIDPHWWHRAIGCPAARVRRRLRRAPGSIKRLAPVALGRDGTRPSTSMSQAPALSGSGDARGPISGS